MTVPPLRTLFIAITSADQSAFTSAHQVAYPRSVECAELSTICGYVAQCSA